MMRCKLTLIVFVTSLFFLQCSDNLLADADTGANDVAGPGDIVPPPDLQNTAPPAPSPQAAPAPVAPAPPPVIAQPLTPAPTPVAASAAPAGDIPTSEPEAEYFYNQLAPYNGQWVNIPDYGPCWQPANVAPDWRPYSLGHWVYTDDNGWLWASDEDFGWCTYHYGRWTQVEGTGWCWVPGHRWGPAWVVWRNGDRYVGWAPLPPGRHGRPIEALIAEVNPYAYNFIDQRFILDEHPREHFEPITRNVTFVSITPNVTRFDLVEGKYINRGMPVADVEHWIGRPIEHFHVAEARDIHGIGIHEHEIALFRPRPPERVVVRGGPAEHANPFFVPGPAREVRPDEAEAARRARDEYYSKIDADMRARHEAELRQPPPNVQHDEMVRRQEQEQHFLEDQRKRDDSPHGPPPQVLRHEERR